MASNEDLRGSEDENAKRQPTLNDLMVQIDNLCIRSGLSYHQIAPISVGPGLWMFYANRRDDACIKYGSCRQQQFFALATDGKLRLT